MTEHKFTDEEVIKAFECCFGNEKLCSECPYEELIGCGRQRDRNILDLINRQKAEIEELKIRNERQRCTIKLYQINETKTEAIKEFAERLRDHIKVVTTLASDENVLAVELHHIENLVKEMTGETI